MDDFNHVAGNTLGGVDSGMATAIGDDRIGMQRADGLERGLGTGAHRLPGLQTYAYVRQNTQRIVRLLG